LIYDCLVISGARTPTNSKPKKRFRQIDNDHYNSRTDSCTVYCTLKFSIIITSVQLNSSIVMSTVKFTNDIIYIYLSASTFQLKVDNKV